MFLFNIPSEIYLFFYYIFAVFCIPFLFITIHPILVFFVGVGIISLFVIKHKNLCYDENITYTTCIHYVMRAYMSGCFNITIMYMWMIYLIIFFYSIYCLVIQKVYGFQAGFEKWDKFVVYHIKKITHEF